MHLLLNCLYLFVLTLLSPWLLWRAWRTGRYRHDNATKLLGTVAVRKTQRSTVWFHGVSVGEIHLLVTVVAAFRIRHPDWHCVISSTTDTGLKEARAKFPDCDVIAWPFDFSWAVANTLDTVKPQLIVLAEAEMWPNFLAAAKTRGVPVAVINARMSPRSFRRFFAVRGAARRLLFGQVSTIGVQTNDYADRFLQLGVRDVRVTGSVKYDGAMGNRDTPKGREFSRLFVSRDATRSVLLLVAGSTHAPEESLVLAAFQQLQLSHPNLHLLLVPRHPDRFGEVAKLLENSGVSFDRRSQITEPLSQTPPVILLDTVGELGAAWGLADLGYVGGTLDGKRGGQSMIEPAGYGVPTVFGPHVWNFRDAAHRLVEIGGATMVKDASELVGAFEDMLSNDTKRTEMGAKSRQFVQEQQGATERTMNLLDELIAKNTVARKAA